MNWSTLDFDWNQARAFLATAEEGSLSAASRALGLTQPTLGRQVAALERALGVALFERVGRRMTLTPTGRDLLPHVAAMGVAAEELVLLATGRSQDMTGTVRISVVDIVATSMLPPILERLQAEAPGLTLDLIVTDSLSDLRRREADIAIRHVRPDDPDLIARKVLDGEAGFFATPERVRQHGGLTSSTDIDGVPFVGFDAPEKMVSDFKHYGLTVTPEHFKLVARSATAGWALTCQGFGVGPMLDVVARQSPGMVRVFPDLPGIPAPFWLTVHREIHTSARIRLVFDILAEGLSRRPMPAKSA